MELKLENGQYTTDHAGRVQTVSGTEELLQRARMRLTAKRGSFLPDLTYGSRLYLLGAHRPSQRSSAAKLYVAEALSGETLLSVGTIEYLPRSDGSAAVVVELLCGGSAAELIVNV